MSLSPVAGVDQQKAKGKNEKSAVRQMSTYFFIFGLSPFWTTK
jgi:hypothetical protein